MAGGDVDLGITPELRRRRAREGRFRIYGIAAILISLSALALLVVSTFAKGVGALTETRLGLDITFERSVLAPAGDISPETLSPETLSPDTLRRANFRPLIVSALEATLGPADDRQTRRDMVELVSAGAGFALAEAAIEDPALLGTTARVWLPAASDVDLLRKGRIDLEVEESLRVLDDRQVAWVEALSESGQLERRFNRTLFTSGDSREPELAGVLGALIGSLLVVLTCFAISFPVGVATAIYLEEFAPKNRFTDFIEVNINNLAAVPSIVYGLLGLYMFLGVMGLPRSTPLVGGMVLALMALPIIIIASRASLRSVPQSVRSAALGLGASRVQATFHQVVPLAMPGMLTGTIIAMARALGETAPLLMIGMVAFIVDVPGGVLDAATTLPVQIFLWFDSPERAFEERASATIIVLLALLVVINLSAVILRRRLERRW